MSKAYVPHDAVRSHPCFKDSSLSESFDFPEAGETFTMQALKYYVETNETAIRRGGAFWTHDWCTFIATVRWDYERQKEAADERP